MTLLCGDAQAVLATLPAESVHCCVTSPRLEARAIEFLGPEITRFHCIGKLWPTWGTSNVSTSMTDTSTFAFFLNVSQNQGIFCLGVLYSKMRKQGTETYSGLLVCNRPGNERSSVWTGRFRDIKRTAKSIMEKLGDIGRYLSQRNALGVDRLTAVLGNAHRIGASFHPDCPIRVYRPGKITKDFMSRHVSSIPWVGGDVKCH